MEEGIKNHCVTDDIALAVDRAAARPAWLGSTVRWKRSVVLRKKFFPARETTVFMARCSAFQARYHKGSPAIASGFFVNLWSFDDFLSSVY